MYRKVRELRLGDTLAEPPVMGKVVSLKLMDTGQMYIEYLARRDNGELYSDLEIRWPADHIEVEEITATSERIADLEERFRQIIGHDAERRAEGMEPSTSVGIRDRDGINLHARIETLVHERRAAETAGTPWLASDTDRLDELVRNLLEEIFAIV